MHQSSLRRMAEFAKRMERKYAGRALRILDVGSMNVNGVYRPLFSWKNVDYVGLDVHPGPNVDFVPRNPYDWIELEDESFDVIISGQTLEHVEYPWLVLEQIARKLKSGGMACVIVPSKGLEHRFPVDCYRYYPDGLNALAKWVGLEVIECDYMKDGEQFPDSSEIWGDCTCILGKLDGTYGRNAAISSHFAAQKTAPSNRDNAIAGIETDVSKASAAFNPLDFPLCFAFPGKLSISPMSAWIQHIPFAFAVVQMLQPKCIVELGVQYGDLFLAFCQAVKMSGLETCCHGVDQWRDDPQTGASGSETLNGLRDYHDPLYGEFSQLIQSSSDQAAAYFPDGGVDLLHIDGYRTHDASRHGFEIWRPKLSQRSVVLFHGINVREHDFGVWKLWRELSELYPHFEFSHGNGLGVLIFGGEAPEPMLQLAESRGKDIRIIRDFYSTLGCGLEFRVNYRSCQDELLKIQEQTSECRNELAALQNRLKLMENSRFWRFRKLLVSIPGLKQVIKRLTAS